MTLQTLLARYRATFVAQYGTRLNPDQWAALHAVDGCRQGDYGELLLNCQACHQGHLKPRSCGHRACNQCQQHSTQTWLDRQTQKQLPVPYYMATFTLPRELRNLARRHRKTVYNALMRCAVETLKTFARNDSSLAADIGLCAVLHTHTRRLDYHPHVHVVIPGGGVDQQRRQWRKVQGRYLFNGKALAKAFRGALLHALEIAGLTVPSTPKRWVAHCDRVGQGLEALRYLSRYLYRGVIRNQNLVADDGRHVTFRYRDGKTGDWQTRTLPGEDFLWLVLQHVLPKGFRRARDYGFLHGNAKALLRLVQWVLRVQAPEKYEKRKAVFPCPHCAGPMVVTGVKLRDRKASPG